MTALPKISVIIPTYNRAHYINEAIDSALAQTYQNVEIVVVDDGSTDETRAVLKGYEDKIRYFYQDHQGISAARNFGIEKSSGQYLAFLDDDDIWFPEMLEVQVAYLEAHPEVGMVHADMLVMDETSDNPRPRKRMLPGPIPSGFILSELIIRNVIMIQTAVVRRSCLDEVGFFDPDNRVSQDYHLWLRIAGKFPITYINRALAIYRIHTTNRRGDGVGPRRHLAALEKVLRLNPEVFDDVGLNIGHYTLGFQTAYKLFNQGSFQTAYKLFNQGSYMEARRYFSKARRIRPFHWPCYGYYLACLLPPSWIIGLRHLKQSFAKARSGMLNKEQLQSLMRLSDKREN